jgi:GTP-binding protein
MKVTATYLSSVGHYSELPASAINEFCILGRSNVGKSSFINHVFGNRKLARVAKRPGTTALANSYRLSDGTIWVDLPGYGHAEAGIEEKGRWSRLISDYCEKRPNLKGVLWLLDIRHPGMAHDFDARRWLASRGLPALPVLTKSDKLSRQDVAKAVAAYRDRFGFPADPVVYSIHDENARERFWRAYDAWRSGL